MTHLNRKLGVAALVAALFLGFVAIPSWVSSPSNVRNIVLSPTFWPYVLTGLLGLTALAMLFGGRDVAGASAEEEDDAPPGGRMRLAGLAAIMLVTMFLLPRLGMVWTSMVAFAITAILFRTRYPKAALVCAVVIPLVLYAFFAHVAGVAVPQGGFVRLP